MLHWEQMCFFLFYVREVLFLLFYTKAVSVGVNVWLMDMPCLNLIFLCYFCESMLDLLKIHQH